MPHLSLDVATMVLEGELPPRILVQMLYDHVKELCPKCREALEAVQGMPFPHDALASHPAGAGIGPEGYLATIDAAGRRLGERLSAAEEERQRARRDLAALRSLPRAARAPRIRAARSRFRSRALAELLVEASRQTTRHDPAEAADLAALVPVVLARVTCPVDRGASPSLTVLAMAQRATALRVGGDLHAADRAFAEVREKLAATVLDDPALHAEVCSLESALRHDQRRLGDAERLLDRAIVLSRMGHDDHTLAQALIQRADLHGVREDRAAAGECLREAMSLLGEDGDRHLLACAVGTLALIECDRGAFAAAENLLRRHRGLLVGDGAVWSTIRVLSLEGRIAVGLGRLAEAEERFAAARRMCLENESELDAAVFGLELAVLYAEQGRMAEVREIARRIQPAFASREVHREATAALVLFQRAVAAERVTVETIRSLRDAVLRPVPTPSTGDEQPS
jgi:tetratricopeptide (TPR) repeat protein